MTTEDALLAAVLAAPDDDVVRKAYADWCRENGQEERADFIEVQLRIAELRAGCSCGECVGLRGGRQHTNGGCAVGRDRVEMPDGSSRRSFVRERQAKLLDENAYLWFPPPLVACLSNTGTLFKTATPGMIAAHITRGFVSEVRCTLVEWCGGDGGEPILFESPAADYDVVYPSRLRRPGIGPQIVRRHPVERVVLTDVVRPSVVVVDGTPFGTVTRESAGPLFDVAFKKSITSRVEGHAEELGKIISDAAIQWAKSQNNPKAAFSTRPMWG